MIKDTQTMPIAIIGIGCRFPGQADRPEKLWDVCAAARNTWSPWPKERLNEKSFTHPQPEHLGTFHSEGGHFLDEDPGRWDASFFNFTADMAKAMDPQIRLLLETTFEAFQTAGLTLEQIAGSETAVFAGSMFRDYHDVVMSDPDNLPRYHVTGNAAAFTANRLSHFFDLRGPSVSVDTACSTTMAALHLACQSLRSGESCMAVVGGANLILHPGSSMSLSNLGLTGKSGRSYSFDKQAEGYGRGEGIASIILKPLVNALADGDPVRAVIRETGMNQDGKTPTITTPSSEAQQRLIHSCYARAGLDPGDTIYVEAHGTGTSAGDGVELRVLGNTLGCKRSHETPLYVGSVKANFGHTESTSGLAAIIKVVMMLEHGQIPPQALFTQGNPHIDFAGLNIKIPTELMLWPDGCMRRASINNFGAGGTNTHVIIEDARYLLQGSYDISLTSQSSASSLGTAWSLEPVGAIARGSEVPEEPLTETETKPQPRRQVFILSARNESGLEETVHKLVDLLDNTSHRSLSLSNLAYTLNERRTHFSWRMAIGASTQAELLNVITDGRPLMKPVKALTASPLRLGFVFTGQGAQWHAMGRELFAVYPVYANALQDAERCLQNLGAEWNLIEELGRSKEDSRLDLPYLSFPVTVILQLALVLLLGSWGIVPSAATGHSSGEIAAAFAAGGLQFHEAITIAYIRGKLTHNLVQTGLAGGKMMAVAVSKVKAAEYIAKTGTETAVVVACVNSPLSVTLSGDAEALDKIEILAQDDNILSRLLRVPAAYHSPEMETIAEDYLVGLATHLQGATDHSFKANFSSPVTGGLVSDVSSIREPSHWVRNMTLPVQFDDCLRAMIFGGSTPGSASAPKVDILVEIGPHGTLQSPIHQILESMGQRRLKEHVITCLRRGEDAVKTMQDLAVFVYCRGGHVDLAQVNNPDALGNPTGRTVVHNAPLYPWDNEVQYWGTPAAINDYMQRPHVRHDILGARIEGISGETAVWCNKLRLADLPWVQHHVVQSEILFPAAGLIAMVTEAMRQLDGKATYAYEVRKVDLAVAVVIPKTQEPIEIQLVIRSPFGQSPNGDEALAEKEFAFYSHTAGSSSWTFHCRGKVGRSIQQPEATEVQDSLSLLPMDVKRFYKFVEQTGPRLGPRFQNISRLEAGDFMAEGTITVPDILAIAPSPGASTYMLHLLILETCIHAAWAALSGATKRNMGISVPRTIQHLFISPYIPSLAGAKLGLTVNVVREDAGGFAVCVSAFDCNDPDRLPLIQIDGLTIVRITDAVAPVPGDELMLLETVWAPSLDLLSPGDLRLHTMATAPAAEQETFRELLQATYNVIHDHLSWLTPDVEAGLEWYQKKYVSWMRAQDAAFYAAHAVPNNGDRRELYARVEASCVDGRLLAIVSKHLQSFLRREANPLEVLMRDGFLSEYYAHMIKMNRCLGHVKAYMHLFAHTYPGSRVLEIGAGVGSCTEPTLQGLMAEQQPGDRASHYTFTDISAGFFEPAARRFAAYADYMTFQKLNIERDPVAQGLIPGAYDLVLSCNCLHATRSLVQTLKYARTLLRPGGKLVLVETTTPHVDQSLAFGLFPGWWLSEEPERADSPLVSAAEWGRYLAAAGFGGLDVVLGDAGEDGDSTYSVMIATAVEETVASISGPRKTIDFAPFPPGIDVPTQDFKSLQAALDSSMGSDLCYFDAAVSSRTKESTVVVLSTGISTLSDLTTDQFDNLKALTLSASKVLWVSRGVAIDTPNPWAALCIGLLRTLRLEYGHNRYVSLDLDPAQDIWHADSVKAICAVLRLMEDDRICEYEFAVRKGEVLVPRLRRYAMQNMVEARMASGESGLGVTTTPAFSLNAGGAYLVVGGLTGIGREVVRWLAREGARYVIAISRRGPTDQPQQTQALAAELETRGCKLIPYACDIADSADLARFLDLARVMLPIRGVINAALALADAAWADMTLQQWKVPLAAKYSGSCNLHAAFAAEELDFFISLSSVTGVVGSHGQANYTAVSTFQDAQARWRVAATQKLPGVSIALGGVLGAGYIQQTAGVAERAARAGWRLHDIREVLWLIELAIRCPRAGQVIAGISQWTVDATAGQQTGASSSSPPAWRRERRFSALPVQNQGNNPAAIDRNEDMDDSVSLGERLLAAESDEARLTMLVDALRHRLADMFVLAPSAIDMAQPLAALGVDSLVAVELRNWLAASGVRDVSIFDVSQSQSLSALAKRLIAKIV